MAPTDNTTVETDQKEAILRIAESNNVIRDQEAKIAELSARQEALKAEVVKYEQAKQEVSKENAQLAAELERNRAALEKQKNALNDSFDSREKELADREEIVSLKEKQLADFEVESTKKRAELEALKAEAEKADADTESKLENIKKIKASRDAEIAELEAKRVEAETEVKKLQVLKAKVEEEAAQLQDLKDRVSESERNAVELSNSITEERRQLEIVRQAAANESSCADFNKATAGHLIQVFRQALHSHVQLAGTAIAIPELTDEHKEWIAKDLLKQIGKDASLIGTPDNGESKPTDEEIEIAITKAYNDGYEKALAEIEAQKQGEVVATTLSGENTPENTENVENPTAEEKTTDSEVSNSNETVVEDTNKKEAKKAQKN